MSLKERIAAANAAIREQAASPPPPHVNGSPPAGTIASSSSAGALRAKIAQFESKGGVPIPRGSFGLGAPPEAKPKQRTELYGNRMQPSRLPSATLGLARPTEAFASVDPRAIPLPPDDTDLASEPSSPIPRSTTTDPIRIPSSGSSNGNALNPFAFEELMRKARAPQTTAAVKVVQEKHKQTAVTTRGTDFTKALETARKAEAEGKAERRRSTLFLQPQFTGGLTPQHTGGLTPQHTGGSLVLAPQTTGGSTRPFSPPPVSPLAAYSPPRSPRESPSSPTSTRPLSFFFAPDERPVVAEPEKEEEDPEPRSPGPQVTEIQTAPSSQTDLPTHLDSTSPLEAEPEPQIVDLPQPEPVQPDLDSGPTSPTSVHTALVHRPGSPDSFHAGLDLDAHLRTHALTGLSHAVSAFDEDEAEDEDPEHVYSLPEEADGEYLAPLPNNLSSHRFRAHLSTITERSIEPGSPAWDVSRFSVGSSAWGDKRASRRESGGYGTAFEYIYEGRDMQEEEEEEEDLDAPVTPGMAGIGASGRPLAFTTSSSSASPSTSTQPANDYKVLLANPDGEPRDDGPPSPSPYRLSYLTDRGYTPSLGSEDGETLEDDDRPQPELDPLTPTSYPHDFEPRTPTLTLDPKTPGMDGVFGLQQIDVEEAESPLLAAPNTNMRDSILSTRSQNSLLSTRDSVLSTQRDSILSTHSRNSVASSAISVSSSALHAQVLTLRPLSTTTLPDSGSPSHVALAHRVPVVDGVRGFERGVAVYVPAAVEAPVDEPTPVIPRRRPPQPMSPPRPSTTYEVGPSTTPPRRPHTTYLLDDDEDGTAEFGTVSFGTEKPHTFSAVVHGRVREPHTTTAGRNWLDNYNDEKRLPMPPMPLSPGYASGELAELLAEAAALEQRLERGELPAEALRRLSRLSMRLPPKFSAPPPPPVPPLPVHQQQQNAAPLKPHRSLRNPLGRSRSDRRPNDQDARPTASSSMANLVGSLGENPVTPEQVLILRSSTSSDIPPTPPPKSPGARYFSSLRRLASTSRSLAVTSTRGSVSTGSEFSSEDSMGLQTPPDDHQATLSPTPSTKGITWPSIKPKRSAGSLGKSAVSLAGKMWPRSRSKSSTSTASSIDTAPSPPTVPVPALPSPPVLRLDPPSFAPIPDDADVTPISQLPHPHSYLSSNPLVSKSKPVAAPRPPHLVLHNANSPTHTPSSTELLPVPKTAPEGRPASWMSVSSTGSSMAPSPLFDKSIFDAFPSVPEMPSSGPVSAHTSRHLPSPSGSFSRTNSVKSSGSGSPTPSVPPLPTLSYSDVSGSTISTPSFSERSFGSGVVGARPNPSSGGSYGGDHVLARAAQTQRSTVQPL